MPVTGNRLPYDLNYTLTDETFDVSQSGCCILTLRIEADRLTCAIQNTQNNKFVSLNDYSLAGDEDAVLELIRNEEVLHSTYKQVSLLYFGKRSTLMPDELMLSERAADYLTLNQGSRVGENTLVSKLSAGVNAIFAIPEGLHNTLSLYHFPIKIYPSVAVLWQCAIAESKDNQGYTVVSRLSADYLEMLILKGQDLLFYNSFKVSTSQDVLYYVVSILNQFQLNWKEQRVIYSGDLEWQYIQNRWPLQLKQTTVASGMEVKALYSHLFADKDKQRYVELFREIRCVS